MTEIIGPRSGPYARPTRHGYWSELGLPPEVVPPVARPIRQPQVDVVAIAAWTAANEACRRAYYSRPSHYGTGWGGQ